MSEDEKIINGSAQSDQLNQMAAQLDSAITVVMGTMIRGICTSAPGAPLQLVLNIIALKCGNLLAQSVVAPIAGHAQVREAFRKAFADGIKAAPMAQPPNQPSAPQTALEQILKRN